MPPLIRAPLECDRLRLSQTPAILQVKREEGCLNAIPIEFRRRTAEVDVAELLSRRRVPPTVIPWPDDEKILVLCVEFLEPLVDLNGPVEILLIPPAGDVERRHGDLRQRWNQRLHLPEAVVVRVRDIVIPRRNL